MATIVEYFDTAFTPGFQNIFDQVQDEHLWRDWYYGRYNRLASTNPSVENGRKLLEPDGMIALPLFQLTSDFMASAALGDMPVYASQNEAAGNWLEANMGFVLKAIRRAGFYWSIGDVCVLAAQPGQVEAVDPVYYFRVGTPDLPDRLVGHILAVTYYEKTREEQLLPHLQLAPNRLRVVKLADGVAMESIYEYAPHTVGPLLVGPRPSPITAICAVGGWDSWYRTVAPTAATLLTQFSIQAQQLNRYANRPQIVPAEALDFIRGQVPGGTDGQINAGTATAIMQRFRQLVYPVVGVTEETRLDVQMDNEDFDGRLAFLEKCYENFFLATGLPPRSFGIGVSRYESGVAIEKSADSASARVQGFRQELADCLPTLVRAMGCPAGEISFNWATPPFQSREAHSTEIKDLFSLGLISIDEARRALGYTDSEEARTALRQEARERAANDARGRTGDTNPQ